MKKKEKTKQFPAFIPAALDDGNSKNYSLDLLWLVWRLDVLCKDPGYYEPIDCCQKSSGGTSR
jgi:hypothetical protein